jgi:hypothetical protein
MTTLPLRRSNRTALILLCATGILFAMTMFVLPALNQHSLERHGSYAVETWQQVCQQGPEATFRRDNRLIHCIKLEDGHYGAVVVEADCQGIECLITAFKSRYQELSDIAKYLIRTGAVPVK